MCETSLKPCVHFGCESCGYSRVKWNNRNTLYSAKVTESKLYTHAPSDTNYTEVFKHYSRTVNVYVQII